MVSQIEPDRYADTGFSVKDTAPKINALIFHRMMQKTPSERMLMGMDMLATARQLVWSTLPPELTDQARRKAFYERFYNEPCPLKK
ncbi:hypothetical protein FEM03_22620 [Phragmitibacter flavus]|uniref:Uncharacterized protein n=1 Tax=Phragmitibacter flavus TaxID=2576071 RepID=A0A5R8K7T6_9BACT|nr:hypothetical protein [Phragmitibacter flavus]TLD68403.1 hypothetical protein FEM03_22620 [Phragmitibacter flavus]